MKSSRPRVPVSVLLSLTLENVRSFRNTTHFSLVASRVADESVRRVVPLADGNTVAVLPSAGLFGANASGKTNLLRALNDLRTLVLQSFRLGSTASGVPRRPFLLEEGLKRAPSSFQVEMVLDGVRWLYGVEIDDECVLEEYATHYPKGRPAVVFARRRDEVKYGAVLKRYQAAFGPLLRPNALLLSVAGAAAENPLSPLFEWFTRNLLLADTKTREARRSVTAHLLDEPEHRSRVLGLLKAADLGISGMERVTPDPEFVERLSRAVR